MADSFFQSLTYIVVRLTCSTDKMRRFCILLNYGTGPVRGSRLHFCIPLSEVELMGLKKAELNGKQGEVVSFDKEAGRYEVRIGPEHTLKVPRRGCLATAIVPSCAIYSATISWT